MALFITELASWALGLNELQTRATCVEVQEEGS
jgi:hypothetical protein